MKLYQYIFIFLPFIMSCTKDENNPTTISNGTGQGGSLALMTITKDYLHVLSGNKLSTFNISNPELINFTSEIFTTRGNSETLFSKGDLLFIGASNGMSIYQTDSTGNNPTYLSSYAHITSCDPVVADNHYAYVTLHSRPINDWDRCSRGLDALDIIDISNLNEIKKIATFSMDSPLGLGVRDSLLFVCDNGFKVYNKTKPLALKKIFYDSKVDARDVIPTQNTIIVLGKTAITQYNVENETVNFLSKLNYAD